MDTAIKLKSKKYEGCRNLFGPLRGNIIKRLETFFAHPSQETWDDVNSLIIGADGMKTPLQLTGKGLLNQDELGH